MMSTFGMMALLGLAVLAVTGIASRYVDMAAEAVWWGLLQAERNGRVEEVKACSSTGLLTGAWCGEGAPYLAHTV